MSLLSILHYPDERLHTIAQPVQKFDAQLQQLIQDMTDTLYAEAGIGLAATQVNVHIQLLMIDLSDTRDQLQVFVNPSILEMQDEIQVEEGCLSVPGIYEQVQRAKWIKVRAQDSTGQPFELETEGLLSICLQHEIDHLNGKVFVEKLSRLKRDRIIQKLKKGRR